MKILFAVGLWLCLEVQPWTSDTPKVLAATPGSQLLDGSDTRAELALAAALVDNLNNGDEDAVVALFDSEATLRADRYAWMSFEIRLWARTQIASSIEVDLEGPFQAVPNRAFWSARVRRADWRQRGVEWVQVVSQIMTEGDRIIDFTSDPVDGVRVAPLGNLWRPGSTPDRLPPIGPNSGVVHRGHSSQADAALAAALPVVLAGVLVAGYAHLGRPRTPPPRRASSLVALKKLAESRRWRGKGG